MFSEEINPVTTPSLHYEEYWKGLLENGLDINKIISFIGDPVKIQGLSVNIKGLGYISTFIQGRFEFRNGNLYVYEVSHGTRIRKLRVKVVQTALHMSFIAACRVSLFDGNIWE